MGYYEFFEITASAGGFTYKTKKRKGALNE